MSQMVTMKDYEHYSGLGFAGAAQVGSEDVESLNKALSAGYESPRMSGSNALRVESLEATLKVTTYLAKHIVFWKDVPKMPAFSTSEEYTVQDSYGTAGGIFTRPGELPQGNDANYLRKVALVKFMGVVGEVDHPTTLVKPAHGDVIALETLNKTMTLLSGINYAMFFGDASVVPQEFDGVFAQIMADPFASVNNVIDLRGQGFTEDNIEDGTNAVVEAYGVPDTLYQAPKALSAMVKQFFPRERIALPAPVNGTVGLAVNKILTQAGLIDLKVETFLRSGGIENKKYAPAGATSNRAAIAPTVAGTAGAVTGSLFTSVDAGTYQYKVTALNRFGESVGGQEAGGVAVVSGDGVSLVITDGGSSGQEACTGYAIYRSKAGGAAGTEQIIAKVPRNASGTTTYVDINQYLPGTSKAFLMQMDLQSLSFKQLAPMMKIPLATLAASIRWMQLLYGVLTLYVPKKNLVYINVGDGPVA